MLSVSMNSQNINRCPKCGTVMNRISPLGEVLDKCFKLVLSCPKCEYSEEI